MFYDISALESCVVQIEKRLIELTTQRSFKICVSLLVFDQYTGFQKGFSKQKRCKIPSTKYVNTEMTKALANWVGDNED